VATRGVPGRLGRYSLSTGRQEAWKELLPADANGVVLVEPMYVTPDGRAYVYAVLRVLSTLYLAEGLR
jgi:hypothetical protein